MSKEVRGAALAEIAEGSMKCVELDGKEILIVHANGRLFAIDALCNHGLAYLEEGSIEDYNIVCPLHGGCFDLRTGAPTREPATEPLRTYPIRVRGSDVFIDLAGIDAAS